VRRNKRLTGETPRPSVLGGLIAIKRIERIHLARMRMRGIVHLDGRRVIRTTDELLARRNQRRVRQRLICSFGKLKLCVAVTLRRAMTLSLSLFLCPSRMSAIAELLARRDISSKGNERFEASRRR